MAMNEIIVIDDDTDLEEGEITDDVVPEIEVLVLPEEKPKQLPRRYTLHSKSSSSRHKNCKHREINRFQAPSKLETPLRKKHKSSCPRHSSEKHRLKHRDVHHNLNPSAFKSAFKNYTSPPRAPPFPKNANLNHEDNDFPKLLLDYKKDRERLKVEKVQNSQDNSYKGNESVPNVNDSVKANISPPKKELPEVVVVEDVSEKKNGQESDEEDVEELRRIALATRAKNQLIGKADEEGSNEVLKPISNNVPSSPNKVLLNHLVVTFPGECDNDSQDNYEVVDMDLDDEEEDSCQIINGDDLYVIDKTPAITEFSPILPDSSQSIQNHNTPVENGNHVHSNYSQTVDDFEEQLLRAEVIASMNSTRQKHQSPPKVLTPVEEKVQEIIAKVDMLHNAKVDLLHNAKVDTVFFKNQLKPKPCTIYSKGPLQNSVRQPPKRIIAAKSKFSNFINNKPTPSPLPPRGVNTIQERLIITLNNDSSTDESEEETSDNIASQNNVPMSSIEALISSARQKSDAAQLNNESSVNVSCLSKAQQEEYNTLKKLLAEKSQYSVPAPLAKEKSFADQSNLLVEQIAKAKVNLEKDVSLRSQIEKELKEKKRTYMASKLRVQMLKEKLHAAEKVRAAKLEDWKQSSAKLAVIGKSVSKRELLLKSLETELNSKNKCLNSNPTAPL